MMKWGKQKSKKSPLSSSSRPSFISHVFPTSWLSKFKQMSIPSQSNTKKAAKNNGKQNCSSINSSNDHQLHERSNGRFYSTGDGDAFWRLSFGDESQENKSKAAASSGWYDLGDEHLVPPLSSHHYRQNAWEQSEDLEVRVDMDLHDEVREFETLRRRFERKAQREFRNKVLEWKRKAVKADMSSNTKEEKDESQLQSPTKIWTPKKHCLLSPSNLDKGSLATKEADFVLNTHEFDTSTTKMKSELPKLKSTKHRKSLHVSSRKPRQNSKIRVYSPRTASKVEICKVKALEDMKKAKSRMHKEKERKYVEEMDADLDSFAVVKCSYNPQKDFRDSMVEMITEKQIRQPEEMEELLACYLTLNSDEYHDLIIKVFKQVWFELDRASFDTELKVSKLRSLC